MPGSKRIVGRDPEYAVYVMGRPLMLVLWCVALWGTLVAARLVWIAVAQGGRAAARFLAMPMVAIPVVLSVLLWAGLFLALRRFRGRDERPDAPSAEEA